MEQYHIEVLVSGDIAKSKGVLQQFVAQVKQNTANSIQCELHFDNNITYLKIENVSFEIACRYVRFYRNLSAVDDNLEWNIQISANAN